MTKWDQRWVVVLTVVVCGVAVGAAQTPSGGSGSAQTAVGPGASGQPSKAESSARQPAAAAGLPKGSTGGRAQGAQKKAAETERSVEKKRAAEEEGAGSSASRSSGADSKTSHSPQPGSRASRAAGGPADRERQFARLDADGDGRLTLEEFLSGRPQSDRTKARRRFFRTDRNDDDQVTLSEFLQYDPKRPLSTHGQFRVRDRNDDGRLSLEEFLEPLRGTPWFDSAQRNFVKCDVNDDGFLSEREFAMTPARKPDARALFAGLDQNQDGRLDEQEFAAFALTEGERARRRREFRRKDADGDGGLTLEEFERPVARSQAGAGRRVGEDVEAAFRRKDRDGDGFLTAEELLGQTRPEASRAEAARRYEERLMLAEDALAAADQDHDGRLSRSEFEQAGLAGWKPGEEVVEPPVEGVEQLGPLATESEPWEWWMVALLVVDALVLAWLAVALVRWWRRPRGGSAPVRASEPSVRGTAGSGTEADPDGSSVGPRPLKTDENENGASQTAATTGGQVPGGEDAECEKPEGSEDS